jgi:hypothetical protein
VKAYVRALQVAEKVTRELLSSVLAG